MKVYEFEKSEEEFGEGADKLISASTSKRYNIVYLVVRVRDEGDVGGVSVYCHDSPGRDYRLCCIAPPAELEASDSHALWWGGTVQGIKKFLVSELGIGGSVQWMRL